MRLGCDPSKDARYFDGPEEADDFDPWKRAEGAALLRLAHTQFDRIVAINTAWAVRPDWDLAIFPDDFPAERHPPSLAPGQVIVRSDDFVPGNNLFGGIVYAGATMAFAAGYWALASLRPKVLAYLGCDMVYPSGQTHFYGTGSADPLRADPTLQNLRAKSARLELLAAQAGCATVHLSEAESVLTFPRANPGSLRGIAAPKRVAGHIAPALAAETTLGAVCPPGRYWEGPPLDTAALAQIDDMWLAAHAAWCAVAAYPPSHSSL